MSNSSAEDEPVHEPGSAILPYGFDRGTAFILDAVGVTRFLDPSDPLPVSIRQNFAHLTDLGIPPGATEDYLTTMHGGVLPPVISRDQFHGWQ